MDPLPTFSPKAFPLGVNGPFKTFNADSLQEKYGGDRGIFHNAETREIAKHLEGLLVALDTKCGFPSLRGLTVVDVGCGTGFITRHLAILVGKEGQVFGAEISHGFLELIRREGVSDNVTLVQTMDDSLSGIPDESAHVVFVCDVYHHFENPHAMNCEMMRVLKPGGVVVLVDFIRDAAVHWSHNPPEWVLDHVRADQIQFESELSRSGLVKIGDVVVDGLSENYVSVLQKPAS